MALGSDRKQFLSSDPTKNKNESDPIRQKKRKIEFNLIRFRYWIGISAKNAFVDAKPTDFRRTSDGLPIRRGHPKLFIHE